MGGSCEWQLPRAFSGSCWFNPAHSLLLPWCPVAGSWLTCSGRPQKGTVLAVPGLPARLQPCPYVLCRGELSPSITTLLSAGCLGTGLGLRFG